MAPSRFAVLLEPDEDGPGFTVLVPSLPGVVTQGDTVEEALANARDAIALTLADDSVRTSGDVPGAVSKRLRDSC